MLTLKTAGPSSRPGIENTWGASHTWGTPQKTDGVNLRMVGNASLRLQILEEKSKSLSSKYLKKTLSSFLAR